MSYLLDLSKDRCFKLQDMIENAVCSTAMKHSAQQQTSISDEGTVWSTCNHCNRITNLQNINKPIIKKKRMVIRA